MMESWREVPCREWDRSRTKAGYGRVRVGDRMTTAHRREWAIHNGPIPDGMCVLHRCDNPPCCEIAHLFLGTQLDNVADRHAKGRTSRASRCQGDIHGMAKLTADDVRAIRSEYAAGGIRQVDLAAKYGIQQPHVSEIVRGKTWSHIS